MPQFQGKLNSNEIFASLYNLIISVEIMSDNIKGVFGQLADAGRVEGSMYGDQKLYYATDVLASKAWGNDAEATNLLQVNRPKDPKVQSIVLDVFRQISLTVDDYLSKRAWQDEGAFASFNSVMLGWIRETKRIYDATLYNTYIGTTVGESNINTIEVKDDGQTYPTLGQGIGEVLADLFVELHKPSRDYNDYKFMRSYDDEDLKVVWNSKYINKVKKIDLPALFHKEGLIEKFEENVLPPSYFGTVNKLTKKTADASTRFLQETVVGDVDYFPGDKVPVGTTIADSTKILIPTYQEDANIICKVMHKRSVPFMSGFEVGTSFFNAKALNENHYLTWGHNTLEYLKDKPMLVVKRID